MKPGHGGSVRRDLGRLFEGESVTGLGEAQLLDRFVERRDDSAFEALVARHGPMVLGVCRRLLADPSDVEDAFQATFLILIRRAGSIRSRDRLAPWLFGVARKVASRTRTDLIRRRSKENPGVDAIATAPGTFDRELNQALFEEIDRLPDSLRQPVLLCCVEGLSYDEAASRMESTAPAVRGRLARGREQLRERLTRRGFAPSVVGVGGLLAGGAASAAVPSKLLMMTTQLSRAGAFPASVEILAEGVIRTMIVTHTKYLAAALLACGLVGSGMGVYTQKGADTTPQPAPAPIPAPDTPTLSDDTIVTPDAPVQVFDTGPDVTPDAPVLVLNTPHAAVAAPDDDRLGNLERKLDRVLEALERSLNRDQPPANPARGRRAPTNPSLVEDDDQPRPARVAVPARAAAPAQIAAPAQPAPPAPPPLMPPSPDLVDPETGRPVAARPRAVRREPAARASAPNGSEGRIDELEQRLNRLEERFTRLVERLDRENEDSGNVTIPPPGRVRKEPHPSPYLDEEDSPFRKSGGLGP